MLRPGVDPEQIAVPGAARRKHWGADSLFSPIAQGGRLSDSLLEYAKSGLLPRCA